MAGESSLHSVELEALEDVSGKKLIHLQCHFDLDNLSWARFGAEVTGVDLIYASMEVGPDVYLRFKNKDYDLPIMFSVKAVKDE